MVTYSVDVGKALGAIVEALDAANPGPTGESGERRREPRRALRTRCRLWTFLEGRRCEVGHNVATRNFSFSGLSVVGKLEKAIATGRPIEAVITMPDMTARHLAGTVTYCRKLQDECSEVGIHVLAVGGGWIVGGDVPAARRSYTWFAEALSVPE